MCIIIVKPAGAALPPLETLAYCSLRNPDGFGYAAPGRVEKFMRFEDFYAALVLNTSADEPVVLHFRYATHGSVCLKNCHPFRDDALGLSFAHNGILDIEPMRGRTDSETAFRKVIALSVKRYGFDSQEMNDAICDIIGPSRFALLRDDGQIRLFGHFIEHGGCWYSNSNFQPFYMSK